MPEIELLPITILVGRNSAGKSTFLRSLPLIRQSLETRTSAPILWYGHLVDFGDLTTAIGEEAGDRRAVFAFTLRDIEKDHYFRYHSNFDHYYYRGRRKVRVSSVSIRYVIGGREDTTQLEAVEVKIPEEKIDVTLQFDSAEDSVGTISVDGVKAGFLSQKYEIRAVNRNLFAPPLLVLRSADGDDADRRFRGPERVLEIALKDILTRRAKRNLSPETYGREIRRIFSEHQFDADAIDRLIATSTTKTFKDIYQQLGPKESSEFKSQVMTIRKLARVFVVLEVLEDELREYFLNVRYLEPVRAASERYYRKQELEVSGIAPDGSNFPMFLASLTADELRKFSDWIEEVFEFGVEVRSQIGHISIHLSSGERSVNVTDTGYGVSQMLPVLGMIWWSRWRHARQRFPRPRSAPIQMLAIEQPELHLHPAHQAKLADVLVAAVGNHGQGSGRPETRLIVETHSEALIQRLGELVEDGKVEASSVQIVVFSALDDLGSPTEVSVSQFDDTGALRDWPYGFFSYSER